MPIDPNQIRLAMIAVTDGADALTRLTAITGAGLDAVRAGAQARDAIRLAGKPGASAAAVAATKARAGRTRADAATSATLAARAKIPPLHVDATHAFVHGRVMKPNGAAVPGIKVKGFNVNNELVSEGTIDGNSYFRLKISPDNNDTLPPVIVVVVRGTEELHRDLLPLKLRPGRTRYREIIIAS